MSQKCIAITVKGPQCKHKGHVFESLCSLHHGLKYKNDPAYKARYDLRFAVPAAVPILMHEEEEEELVVPVPKARKPKKREPKVPPPAPPTPEEVAAAAAAAAETAAAANRAKKITARTEYLEKLNTPSADSLLSNALYIVKLATDFNGMEGYNSPIKESAKVYAILRYYPINANVLILLKAVATFDCFTSISYSDHTILTIPNERREELFEGIKTALIIFGEFNPLEKIPRTDKYFRTIRAKLRRIQDEERRVAQEAADAAARAALMAEHAAMIAALNPAEIERRRLFNIQLREAPVVFKRDPEGGIDLAAFATDMQNIHRSSVQTSTQKAVAQLMLRSVDPDQDTLPEITKDLQDLKKITMTNDTRERIIMELNHDYYECVAFSVSYGDVLDRVWTFIRNHEHRNDILLRLAQEILEGIRMCTNGKMARLVNVVQGFDETLLVDAPKEVFQDKFALLRKLPIAEREDAAKKIFVEFSIPNAEQAVWMEALLEE